MSSNLQNTKNHLYGGQVLASGAVLGASDGFTVTRLASASEGFLLEWGSPIADKKYVVTADLNIEGLYRVPSSERSETSCIIIISNHAGTELFNNFNVLVQGY